MKKRTISKILSANDSGETGGHQAGLLIPKEKRILSFFPPLDGSQLNPRAHIHFKDEVEYQWEFAFIYYNNRFFGGTRNEYRLTRMTRFIQEAGLVAGDEIRMHRRDEGDYLISYRRSRERPVSVNKTGQTVIKLSRGWKIIDL